METMTKPDTTCGACKQEFPTLEEVFTHPCDAIGPIEGTVGFERSSSRGSGCGQTSNQYGTFDNHAATEKQVAFIQKLMAERGVDPSVLPTNITKAAASKSIEDLLAIKPLDQAPVAPANRKANRYAARCVNCGAQVPAEGGYLVKDAQGKWAAEHIACPAKEEAAPEVPAYEPSKGDVHVIDGEYYRVHQSQGTGRFYAAIFEDGRFEYARGVIARCNAENLATAEQAAAFGHLFHRCVFCSRELDLPASIEVGYGQVCAGKHNLPWGT